MGFSPGCCTTLSLLHEPPDTTGFKFVPSYPANIAPTRNGYANHNGVNRNGVVPTSKYGKASLHDFDNPNKWVTVPDVKVLDEHELDGEDGKPAAYVDRQVLEEIAANNNNRVLATGDPAPLIVGHTSDDPRAEERPVVGYAVNYKVRESRDPATGKLSYAIHTDYKVRKKHEHVIEDYPRRSVELWLGRKELDPIALLGGTTPERDLGVIIRKSRISGFTLDSTHATDGIRDLEPNEGPSLHYSARKGQVIRYAMACDESDAQDEESTQSYSHHGSKGMNAMKGTNRKPAGMGKMTSKKSYEADTDDEDDGKKMYGMGADDGMGSEDLPPDMDDQGSDSMGGEGGGGDPGAEDPAIAAIFQSKSFQSMLAQAVQTAIQGLLAEEEGGAAGGAGPAPAPPPGGAMPPQAGPPGMGDEQAPPDGTDGLAPQPDEEARIDHEGPPVRFGAGDSTGMAGPMSTRIPATNGDRRQAYNRQPTPNGSSRPMTRTQPQQAASRQNPEVVRLSRKLAEQDKLIKDLVIRNARVEAEKLISDFENNVDGHEEGPVLFGDREQEINVLTAMDPQSREYHIENIRVNYRRAGHTSGPTDSRAADTLFRMSRTDDGGKPVADEDYEPKNAQEAVQLADAQTGRYTNGKPMSLGEAVKYMRERQAKTRQRR